MNLAFDVGEFLLQVPGRVLHALVVDGGTEMAHEEVDEAFGAERTQRLVEFVLEMVL